MSESHTRPPQRRQGKTRRSKRLLPAELEQLNLHAAGIDVGAEEHWVSVGAGCDPEGGDVRRFGAFTGDLNALAQWLESCGIETVAMESTGVYWIPLYELLVERGFEVLLVDARHTKNVSGRKSDVLDCQWLQQLHLYGLLRGAFRPAEQVCTLRSYLRQRSMLVRYAAQHIQHMQKALEQMNLKLSHVITDITGATGMAILRAIVQGERDPRELAKFRDPRCKNPELTIAQALEGHYRDEHVFALGQALALFDQYQHQLAACDHQIERCLGTFDAKTQAPLPQARRPRRRHSHTQPHYDVRRYLHTVTGVDLTTLDSIDVNTALTVIGEIGLDMTRWPTEKHFGSWLGLAPGTRISGGKRISGRSKPTANRAAAALRLAAQALSNSKSALGAYYRRLRARIGAPKAITATAYKIARTIYRMLKSGRDYTDPGEAYYEQRFRERTLNNLKRRARTLGFEIVPASATP